VKIEALLKEKGIELPEPARSVANYVTSVRTGNLIFTSGHGPQKHIPSGKVGKELTIEQGYEAARNTALCLISTLKDALGDLDKVKRIVKLVGFVNCAKAHQTFLLRSLAIKENMPVLPLACINCPVVFLLRLR
jgi:enamine deaminase RidA (YjgF/YER057c/UK114 family)